MQRVSVQAKSATTGAFVERWHDDIAYSGDALGIAYYLASVSRVFASGESAPKASYTYRLPAAEWGASAPRAIPELDALLVGDPGDLIQPSRTAVLDVDDDGRPDLERASDLRTFIHGDGSFAAQDLPPATGHESVDCRPAPLYENDPRLLARMRAPTGPMDVVVLRTSAFRESTSLTVCDRAGNVRTQATLTGDWDPTTATKLVDVTHDHLPDLVRIAAGEYAVLPNVGNDAFGPVRVGTLSPAFEPSGSWVQDMNGDGIADLVARSSDSVAVWLGHGQLAFDSDAQIFLFYDSGLNVASLDGYTFAFLDANKDGLSDLLLTKDNQSALFINSGSAFEKADVAGLQMIPAFAGNPVPIDLAGTGDTELTYVFDGKGSSLALDHAETALLVGANDGKGNLLSFRYGRAQPVAGARTRHSVLSQLTVASTGEDPVTYEYAYASPKLHSEGLFLLGFEDVTRHAPLEADTMTFLNEDRYSGLLLSSTTHDDLMPGVEKVEFRTYADVTSFGVTWRRLATKGEGWKSTDPLRPAVVLEQTEVAEYTLDVCPSVVRKATRSGTLTTQTDSVVPAAFAESLACVASHIVMTGAHADSSLDFRYDARLTRNDAGQLTRLTVSNGHGASLVEQDVAYTFDGQPASIARPGRGVVLPEYDPSTRLLSRLTSPDGMVSEVVDRDPVTDALRSIATRHGVLGATASYRYDGRERLAKVWSDVGHSSEVRPETAYTYREADSARLAMVRTVSLVDGLAGTFAERGELFAADGQTLARTSRIPEGWAVDTLTAHSRTAREVRGYRAKPVADIASVDATSLFAGADLVTHGQSSLFGDRTTTAERFHAGVERLVQSSLTLDSELTRADVENGIYTTQTSMDAARHVVGITDPSGARTAFSYDALGRLRHVRLADGATHKVTLDDFGRPSRIERSGVGSIAYAYEAETGLLLTTTYIGADGADARKIDYRYDGVGRTVTETHTDAKTARSQTFMYYYDEETPEDPAARGQAGLLTAITGDRYVKHVGYRADGKVTSTRIDIAAWRRVEDIVNYGDDGTANDTTRIVRDEAGTELFRTTAVTTRDTFGRKAAETLDGAPFVTYAYDVEGLPAWAQLAQGGSAHGEIATFQRDPLTRAQLGINLHSATWSAATSQRMNARGLVDSEDVLVGAAKRHRTYAYSAQAFLAQSADEADSYAYAYDSTGLPSRTTSDVGGTREERLFIRSGPTLTAGTHHHTFDALGRVVERDDVTMTYGPLGQVETATKAGTSWSFVYDEAAQRVAKVASDGHVIAVYLGDCYIDETSMTAPIRAAGALVGVLRHTRVAGGGAHSAFLAVPADARGTILADSDGTLRMASPFGDRAVHPDIAAALDYAEKRWDASLGTVRMGARDYDPAVGRWLQPDPLFLAEPERIVKRPVDGALYVYAMNDPLRLVDPEGTQESPAAAHYIEWRNKELAAGHTDVVEATDQMRFKGAIAALGTSVGGWVAALVPRGVWLAAALLSTTQIKSSDDAAGHFTAGAIAAGAVGGARAVPAVSGFSAVERTIIAEVRGMLASPQIAEIRSAAAAGKEACVQIGGRYVQYEPGMPASGFTDFEGNGFTLGREAFKSEEEFVKTLLHETHRLTTSQSLTEGVGAELAARETKAAADFADRAHDTVTTK